MSITSAQSPAEERAALSRGYTSASRSIETLAIGAFFVLLGYILLQVVSFLTSHPLLALLIGVVGYIAADFTSGFVHWLGDTWGTTNIPVFGKTFIRPFREHHVDQMAITRHDFVETNGLNCLANVLVLLPFLGLYLVIGPSVLAHAILLFLVALSLGVFGTNQFHKWAHLEHPPRVIRWLQNTRVIMSPAHHAVHHASPYDTYYCITVGWLNPILQRINFFRRLEKVISRATGAIPRQHDLALTAESEVAAHHESLALLAENIHEPAPAPVTVRVEE